MPNPVARTLVVWNNHTRIGELREFNNLWQFEYDAQWSDFDLCPQLPRDTVLIVDGASTRPVQWFFDNLLPEEGARELLARGAKIDKADAFGLLETFGAESAGALTLLPPNEEPGTGLTRLMPYEELSERIRNLPKAALSAGTKKKMSLAGAQHKIPIVFDGGTLYAPDESYPSTHILKPDHPESNNFQHSVVNEWFVMSLAGQLGLVVPEVTMLNVPEPVYLIERFDRIAESGTIRRIHAIDACQVLSLDKAYKYQECNTENLNRLIGLSRYRGETRQRLLQWFLFNILVGNSDDHLKNLSFIPAGSQLILTPHYDLLSTAVYAPDNGWGAVTIEWPIGNAKIYSQITLNDIHLLAATLKLPKRYADSIVQRFCSQIFKCADRLIETHQSSDSPGLAKAGQLRLLRSIRFGVINDMVDQLTQ
ncbi:MAG: HipA domain-containing protein [Motiliproteus sp.]